MLWNSCAGGHDNVGITSPPLNQPWNTPPHCTRRPSQLNLQLNLRSVTCRNFPAFHFNISNVFLSTVRMFDSWLWCFARKPLTRVGEIPGCPPPFARCPRCRVLCVCARTCVHSNFYPTPLYCFTAIDSRSFVSIEWRHRRWRTFCTWQKHDEVSSLKLDFSDVIGDVTHVFFIWDGVKS